MFSRLLGSYLDLLATLRTHLGFVLAPRTESRRARQERLKAHAPARLRRALLTADIEEASESLWRVLFGAQA